MGQLGSNIQNPNITGPQANRAQWGDLDPNEKGARLLGGATQGLARGFQNYQQQNSQMRGLPQQTTGPNNLNFYGGSY